MCLSLQTTPDSCQGALTVSSTFSLRIQCLWPRAGAARSLHKFPAAEPFPSFPTPNAVSIPGVGLPEALQQTLGEPPLVVWKWRRRDGQGAPLARVQLHPAFTFPPQGKRMSGKGIATSARGEERGWSYRS